MEERPEPRVLIVEDDAPTAAWVVRGLCGVGFAATLVTNGAAAIERIAREPWDAMVLDLMLPAASGFEVLERARYRTSFPTVVVTARSDLADRLRAFELGAADYLAKPFFLEELVVRLRSRMRRSTGAAKRIVAWGSVRVDLDARTVEVDGRPAVLTPTELSILSYLCERDGRAISRAVLAQNALASMDAPDARTVDSHVARLRRKLGAGASAIVTVWGIGYRLDRPERKASTREEA